MKETNVKLTKTLPLAMEKMGMDVSNLSSLTKIDESRIKDFLSGEKEPNFEELLSLSKVLKVSIDFLLTGEEFK